MISAFHVAVPLEGLNVAGTGASKSKHRASLIEKRTGGSHCQHIGAHAKTADRDKGREDWMSADVRASRPLGEAHTSGGRLAPNTSTRQKVVAGFGAQEPPVGVGVIDTSGLRGGACALPRRRRDGCQVSISGGSGNAWKAPGGGPVAKVVRNFESKTTDAEGYFPR